MSSSYFEKVKAATTGSGTTDGYVPVAANSVFTVGAFAYLRGPAGSPASQYCRITDLRGSTEVGVVFYPESITDPKLGTGTVKFPSYGRNDVSSFPINSILSQFAQPIDVP